MYIKNSTSWLNVLCIKFKIKAFFITTLLTQLYGRVDILLLTQLYGRVGILLLSQLYGRVGILPLTQLYGKVGILLLTQLYGGGVGILLLTQLYGTVGMLLLTQLYGRVGIWKALAWQQHSIKSLESGTKSESLVLSKYILSLQRR